MRYKLYAGLSLTAAQVCPNLRADVSQAPRYARLVQYGSEQNSSFAFPFVERVTLINAKASSEPLHRDFSTALISEIECTVKIGERDHAVVDVEEELSVLAGGVALLQLIDIFGMIVRV
jgi:hypothetical protein